MSLQYKGYNFIIFLPDEKLSSAAYFNITYDNDNVYATMLKDRNFSFIDEGKYKYDIYLANGNLYSIVNKIKQGIMSNYKFCSFNTDSYKNLMNHKVEISFSQNKIDEGLYLSNPIITIKKTFLDEFIDNL